MKTTLEHLPALKQRELQNIVALIRQRPEVSMVILFGSYARGDWVEELADDDVHFKYQSDFDLLLVVETPSASEQNRLKWEIEETIEHLPGKNTPLSIIVHDIAFINRRLERAQYFFSDIKKEGVLLYDSGQLKLKEPRELNQRERYKLAKEDFEYYIEKAKKLIHYFEVKFENKDYNEAAFELHQVTERLYSAILLVFTRYKPNTHNLHELRKLVNALDQRFIKIFSLSSNEEKQRFELLCKAYVDARYKKSYVITQEELNWLAEQVKELERITEMLCKEKIESFLR